MATVGEWAEIHAAMRQREIEAHFNREDAAKILGHYLWRLSSLDDEMVLYGDQLRGQIFNLRDELWQLGIYVRPLTGLEAHNLLQIPLSENYDWTKPYDWMDDYGDWML